MLHDGEGQWLRFRMFADCQQLKANACRAGHQSGGARFPSPREAPHDLWMAFFNDPDGHTLALMHEAPKGYALPQ
jgi:hypothetical protein